MTTESVGFEDAVGRQRSERDEVTLFPARGMRALLDCDPEAMALGGVLPWGWHWWRAALLRAAPAGRCGRESVDHQERH